MRSYLSSATPLRPHPAPFCPLLTLPQHKDLAAAFELFKQLEQRVLKARQPIHAALQVCTGAGFVASEAAHRA